MAKKNQKDDVTQDVQTAPDEQAQPQVETSADNAESAVEKYDESDDKEGQVIVPIGYSVKLREIHPQATYGRCGYRFNKESAVEIPVENLTSEQVIMLAEDPWLELIPICEK
ncbi:hypothetical protein AO053_00390 [Haemophilus influenzae biotype aegyptius]|uniref:hypothetical protein n=1 Tax=Haemophilus influenzae TaxID=727 RepID=UPI0001F36911|nr:hypothetical protein [Haemophilus influenzae]QEQ60660.1 hypothetical protein F1540_08360 [Haemophilus influenzae biotype aegyptius]QEQ62676.1 hypothetical protein F1539_10120 [Haemophilus influenzae biotype aegyptius]QEQ63608.1 hypothetical protein F1538_04950 [Haemophilus influenzae biotype aegyptius]QEQ66241.1 hypothetical protein F1537_09500 [Haemophilus influenzae biotype aegyptius]TMQ37184.1 hypothetical protein AO051_07195 [Haemophilus influenzae biotype aegyptius]